LIIDIIPGETGAQVSAHSQATAGALIARSSQRAWLIWIVIFIVLFPFMGYL